uniref:Uncharacterized protein n=1 Tax=Anguilla anguilla TaxID=7936 RepID=A0A0E9W496_ANGAN
MHYILYNRLCSVILPMNVYTDRKCNLQLWYSFLINQINNGFYSRCTNIWRMASLM